MEDLQLDRLVSPASAARAPNATETQEMIDILGLEEQEVSLNPEKDLEEAEAIINDLSDLRSTLLDPYDDDDPGSPPDAVQLESVDREYIQRVFTQASGSQFLVHRLLAANRRRRRNIYHLRRSSPGEFVNVNTQDKTRILSIVDNPQLNPRHVAFRGCMRSKGFSSEADASKTVPSTKNGRRSLFSTDLNDETKSATSFTSGGNTGSLSIIPELQPPRPSRPQAVWSEARLIST